MKTTTRYFFSEPALTSEAWNDDQLDRIYGGIKPLNALQLVAAVCTELELVKPMEAGTSVYRVRREMGTPLPHTFKSLGPPPTGLTAAGRMNPCGISYFYLAMEKQTAVGEVVTRPPTQVAIAQFKLTNRVWILDLTSLPELPSIFDEKQSEARESLMFLTDFVKAISEPITRDGREHIDYVPSQIVSEYFAQVFKQANGGTIAGIAYPSAVVPGGRNLVLFPRMTVKGYWDAILKLARVEHFDIPHWVDLNRHISI